MNHKGLVLLLVAASGLVSSPAWPAPPARPNTVFILTDDQRWDTLGAAGNRIIRTPNLDRLASEGVLFTHSFDTTPVCYASRATLLTGQFNRRHGVDVAPTLLDAAGVPIPPAMQGMSLRPLVFGEPAAWRQDWFFEHHLKSFPLIPESEGVRGLRFKYVRYTSQEPVYEQLFDLASDPYEERDILHTPAVFDQRPWYYRKILRDLRQRWLDLRTALE
jgi:arylsulfatase A-like enzyme